MRRGTLAAIAGLTCAALVAVPVSAADAAPSTDGGSAYSAAAGTGTATLSPNLHLTGAVGGLLDGLISPIVDGTLNPLLDALTASVNSLIDAALGASSTANVGTPPEQSGTAPAAFPTDPMPTPCVITGSLPCYQLTSGPVSVDVPPLVSVQAGVLQGYTQQVPATADATNPIIARAQVADPSVSALSGLSPVLGGLLGVSNPLDPLVSAGVVDAKANCPNDGAVGATKPATAPTALASATDVRLLGGLITFGVLNGQISNLVVDGQSFAQVSDLPVLTITGITVQSFGLAVQVIIPLTVDQLLAGLGLPASVVTKLLGMARSSTMALTLTVGPHTTVTSTTATAWGLGIGVDLSGTLGFDLLGLVGARISVPTGLTGDNVGNLADLRLAYTRCGSGVITPPIVPPVPPALV